MIAAYGQAVLPFDASGEIAPLGDMEAAIVWAESLTVPAARIFLASNAKLIVTRVGNPVCHGANLLRVAKLNGRETGWISGLTVSGSGHALASKHGGLEILDGDAQVSAYETGSYGQKAIFEFRERQRTAVCLWPDRSYSRQEFMLQKSGLEESASNICIQDVIVNRDSRGRIWFESGKLDEEVIKKRALDREYALGRLREMVRSYDQLSSRIGSISFLDIRADELNQLGRIFFADLLLFHSCYADIMYSSAKSLSGLISPNLALEISATNVISRWLYDLDKFQSSSKQGTPAEWWRTLPPLSVFEAVRSTRELLVKASLSRAFNEEEKDNLDVLATLSVVKEMKMILAKNLFAGVAKLEGCG